MVPNNYCNITADAALTVNNVQCSESLNTAYINTQVAARDPKTGIATLTIDSMFKANTPAECYDSDNNFFIQFSCI